MNDTFDNGGEEVEDRPMSALTREEFHAKLETAKVRQDARAASIEARIDAFSDRVDARFARADDRFSRIDERFTRIDERFEGVDQRLDRVDERFDQVDKRIDQLRTTIILTGITSAITIVLGMAAFNAALLSNMIASYDTGREVARDQAEVRRQIEETAVLLRQLQAAAPPREHTK